MKKLYFCIFALFFLGISFAQQTQSSYDYTQAFAPNFYSTTATTYRSASGKPGPKYWQNEAHYTIKASLDPEHNKITANLTLRYVNNSPDTLDYIWLQLDQNLFQKNSIGQKTTPQSASRYGDAASEFDGGFEFTEIKLDAKTSERYTINDTRMRIDLPNSLAPEGGEITIGISYSYIIPQYGADRTGIQATENGNIYAIAQWYPRVSVYDDILGWNTTPYTGPGEFYLEYGDYQVEVTVPSDHIVVMGAELLNPEEVWSDEQLRRLDQARNSSKTVIIRDEKEVNEIANLSSKSKQQKTWKFELKNARDIAWASSAAFIIDAAKISIGSNKSILAMSAYPKESIGNNGWERSTEYTKAAIEHYSAKWFEYPYPIAVNVASNVAGMEYPAISFCSFDAKGADLWDVTDHEFGHNWFPMIVGSNERLHGWMDEGLNMFMNTLSTKQFNKGEYHSNIGARNAIAKAFSSKSLEPVMSTPQGIKERNIGLLVYYKPQYGLELLREEIIGKESFDKAFRTYIKNWAYKHPTPDDFFRCIENETGVDLAWFWRGWFLNNWLLDQAIEKVEYILASPNNGALVTISNLEQLPMPVVIEATTESGEKHRIKLPVDIWQNTNKWTVKIPTQEKLEKVIIDPDRKYPDTNPENNVWTSK